MKQGCLKSLLPDSSLLMSLPRLLLSHLRWETLTCEERRRGCKNGEMRRGVNSTPMSWKQKRCDMEHKSACDSVRQVLPSNPFYIDVFSAVTTYTASLKADQQGPPIPCLYLLYRPVRRNTGAIFLPWTGFVKGNGQRREWHFLHTLLERIESWKLHLSAKWSLSFN